MLWSSQMPDGSLLCIERGYKHSKNGKTERRYLVSIMLGGAGMRLGVCHLGPRGKVVSWFRHSKWIQDQENRTAVKRMLIGIDQFLCVEQVLSQ